MNVNKEKLNTMNVFQESGQRVMGQYYSNSISNNVKRAFEQKRRNGEWIGSVPYGYKRINKDIVIDREKAKIVRYIYKVSKKGIITTDIKKKINKKAEKDFKFRQIKQILENPFYKGFMEFEGKIYPHKYENIL